METKNIVIATGSAPAELPFAKFDGKTIVSSTEALEFTEAPKETRCDWRRSDRA